MSGKTTNPPQDMNARLEWGAAASLTVMNERNHVRPEGERQRAECGHEDQCDTCKNGQRSLWRLMLAPSAIVAIAPIAGKANRYGRSIHRSMIGRRSASALDEDDDQENQEADREYGDLPVRHVADLTVAFHDKPAGAEKPVADATDQRHTTRQTG